MLYLYMCVCLCMHVCVYDSMYSNIKYICSMQIPVTLKFIHLPYTQTISLSLYIYIYIHRCFHPPSNMLYIYSGEPRPNVPLN